MNDNAEDQKFSLVWQECGIESEIARRFFVPGFEGYLPFFVWGEELKALERKEEIELREEHLLKGILYGLHELEEQKYPWHRKKDIPTYLYLLEVLGRGFGIEDPERLILDVASNVREKNGSRASYGVLEAGKDLVPQSSGIKSDLILDLWGLSIQDGDANGPLREIVELLPQVDLNSILPYAKEVICYYGLCATVLLGKNDNIDSFLEKYIYPNVTHKKIKERIKDLLENRSAFRPADLSLGS